jgi:hypothetical protein
MTSQTDAAQRSAGRLSIAYLLCLTAGIGIAITVARGIEQLRFSADSWYYNQDAPAEIDRGGLLVASLYGLCLTTFLFAIRSGRIWESPGKILALLFACMCLLNWGLDAFAGAVASYRTSFELHTAFPIARGVGDPRGYIAGIWYRNFAPSVGYVVALPLLAYVLVKTRNQRTAWRAVWMGFLAFDLLVIADIYFRASSFLPPNLDRWYFELALGLPLTLLAVALLDSIFRRERVDWWTAFVSLPLLVAWAIGLALKSLN